MNLGFCAAANGDWSEKERVFGWVGGWAITGMRKGGREGGRELKIKG